MNTNNRQIAKPTIQQNNIKFVDIPATDDLCLRIVKDDKTTESMLDGVAKDKLGIILEVKNSEFIGSTEGRYELGNGWSCRWYILTNKCVLKLVTKDPRKKRLLDEGVVQFFVSKGLMKFYAVALVNSSVKYKFQLIDSLVAIINNSGYLQAFRHHPVYNNLYDQQLSHQWVKSWCQNIELPNRNIFQSKSHPILCELVSMVRIVDRSEKYRQEKQAQKKQEIKEVAECS